MHTQTDSTLRTEVEMLRLICEKGNQGNQKTSGIKCEYRCDAPNPEGLVDNSRKPVDIGCPDITLTCLIYRDPFLHI